MGALQRWRNRAGTLLRVAGYTPMTKPDTWYVEYEPLTGADPDGATRKSRKFKSEIDAKLFAEQMLAKGWRVGAGTLDTVEPSTTIPPAAISQWAAPPAPR
jgi:hypothetical protein